MFIIQNLACVPILLNREDHRTIFFKDVLKNKRVNKIMIYTGSPSGDVLSPYILYQTVSSYVFMDTLSLFLSLTDNKNKKFINDLNLRDFTIKTDHKNNFVEILINRVLDYNQSFVNWKVDTNGFEKAYFPFYFFYQKQKLNSFSDEIKGSVTVQITPSAEWEDIQLSTIINNILKGKFIKKIIYKPMSLVENAGYLDIVCKDGKHIENIPLDFLCIKSPKDFWFDLLDIDFEKSYYRNRRTLNEYIYTFSLTFIY